MSELKLPRLLAAAKEFNVGQDTIVDFLAKKGFNKDELKPTAKLSEDMYRALQNEFQKDKQAKNKADLVEIPKSQQSERRRRDEEDLSFGRKEDRNKVVSAPKEKEEAPAPPVVVEVIAPEVKPEVIVEVKPIVAEVTVSPVIIPSVAATPEPIINKPEAIVEKIIPAVEPIVEAPKETIKPIDPIVAEVPTIIPTTIENEVPKVEIKKIEAPEIVGPKILNKIDLSAIDSSTRPRKNVVTKKEEPNEPISVAKPTINEPIEATLAPKAVEIVSKETEEVKPTPVAAPEVKTEIPTIKQEEVVAPQPVKEVVEVPMPKAPAPIGVAPIKPIEKAEPPQVISATPEVEDTAPIIENIQAEKLTGPVILRKIELPIDSDTRPKQLSAEDKKKRKRIPVENKRVGGSHPNANQHPNNAHGQHPNNANAHGHQQHGGNVQNKAGHQHPAQNQPNTGNFNRENRPASGYQPGAGHSVSHQQPANTGNSRPVVPANNRGGGQGGGNFNRDARGGQNQNNRGGQGGGFNRAAGTGNNRPIVRKEDKEIDAKEIQDKIKETQAKLSGGSGRGKSLKAKYRRAKREEAAEAMSGLGTDDNKLQVTEFVTVSELANLMDVSFADVIGKCMGLGIMVSINQRLDAEVIELVASEFNFEVEFIGLDDVEEEDDDDDNEDSVDAQTRPPIVTIMGHVDHGKTSLLDYIRNANVVAGEAGGITQHIGAYEVTLPNGKAITFLDTPGHEAFTAMRARGAKVTDIAVIVVAADDAVMPQTKEAISHAQAAGVPMIFAVNKIDKDGANPQKIYEQLANMNILVESWGGKYQSQELSAKKGLAVDLLLEKILLEAELLDVKANAEKEAVGSIIEASLDKGRGFVATILVQNGTLKQGDLIVSGQNYGRVKAMFNERNQRVEIAPPSTPVVILGLNGAPQAGEKFKVYNDEAEAKEVANKRAQIAREQGLRARKHITLDEIGRRLALGNFKELNIIIKGDVDGSVEALSDSLQKLSNQEIAIRIVHKAVGQISESDILLAAASDAIIVGFNVRPSAQASKLATNEGVQVKMYSIIYTAIDEIRSAMEGMLEPKVEEKEVATIDVKEVFKFDKVTVAGCYVQEGKVKRDHKIRVFRDGILVYPRQEGGYAELGSLKRFKDDVKEVNNAYECGLTVKGFADLNVGDTIIAYEEEEVKRTL